MSTIFSATLGTSNTGNSGYSTRGFFTPSAGSSGQVRVTFQAGSPGNWKCTHAAIAVQGAATAPNVAATPTELLFSGASGFNLATGTSLASDWLTFSFLNTDTLCIITDDDTSGNGDAGDIAFGGSLANVLTPYFKAATSSYNQATVTGFTTGAAGQDFGIILIETQAAPGGATDDYALRSGSLITSLIQW